LEVRTARLSPGLHQKALIVDCNDATGSRRQLPIDWTVIGLLEPLGGSIVQLNGLYDREIDVVVELVRGIDSPIEIEAAQSSKSRFRVLGIEPIVPGERYRFRLRLPVYPKPARTQDFLDVHVRVEGAGRSFLLPVSIQRFAHIEFRPAANVAFRRDDTRRLLAGSNVERTIDLVAMDPEFEFEVTEVQVIGDTTAFEVEPVSIVSSPSPLREGTVLRYAIRVTRFWDRPVARAHAEFHTNDPDQPILRLPLHAQFDVK
ncbi:MAG: hypothetical protein KDC38_18460, partial [Planctomycetes bacterium]|nr:hypothetical protein [Planctomycetota bacterium]